MFLRSDKPGWNAKFEKLKESYYPRLYDDWFKEKLKNQLIHEGQVKEHIDKNKLSEVVVNGQRFQINCDSFKIEFDFMEQFEHCKVCNKGYDGKLRLK